MVRFASDLPLVGRDQELAELASSLDAAARGMGQAVVVEGEAGIGKTRLLREAMTHAEKLGFKVFSSAGDELEQTRDFGALQRALDIDVASADPMRRTVAALMAEPLPATERRLGAIDGIYSVIEAECARAPVALVLDDLHWTDDETLRALRSLARRSVGLPLFFVGACRAVPMNAERERLQAQSKRIVLDPLGDDAVSELVDLLVTSKSTAIHSLVSAANGNPFFVIEVLAAGFDRAADEAMPSDLRRTILDRLLPLSEDARSILRWASLLGSSIEPADLEALSGRSAVEIVPFLDESLKAGILEERGPDLTFRHDIVRQAIYADIPASVRKQLHRDAGHALAAENAPAARVAFHLATSAEPGDAEAVAWLRRAATEEVGRSPATAASLIGRAIELVDPGDRLADRLIAERAQALVWAGDVAEAEGLVRDVLWRLRDPVLEADLRAAFSESLFLQGRLTEASDEIERAASVAPDGRRAFHLAGASLAAICTGQMSRGEELARRALTEVFDATGHSMATGVLSEIAGRRGEPGRVELAQRAVAIADEDPSGSAHRYGAYAYLGNAYLEEDRFDDAARAYLRGLALDEARGVGWAAAIYHGGLGLAHFYSGEWDDAIVEFETVLTTLDDMDSRLFKPLAHGVLAAIAFHRGDMARAEEQARLGEADLEVTGMQVGVEWIVYTRAAMLAANGELGQASALALQAAEVVAGTDLLLGARYIGPLAIKVASANGDVAAASETASVVERLASTLVTPSMTGTALWCRGIADGDGDTLLRAVDVLRSSGRPRECAGACEDAALAVLKAGDRDRAEALFAEALETLERMGATGDAARIANVAKRRRPRRAAGPAEGWESLSRTELRCVALVAEGLSNAAIAERLSVSRRTVETHLYHVFSKVGVSTRTELALRAAKGLPEVQ